MLENMKKNWGKITFVLFLWSTLFGYTINEFANAGEALEQISKVALALENPKSDLVDYLINKGISKKQAKEFAQYNIGPNDTLGVELEVGSYFLGQKDIYQIGVLHKIKEPSKHKILDTLWNFKE